MAAPCAAGVLLALALAVGLAACPARSQAPAAPAPLAEPARTPLPSRGLDADEARIVAYVDAHAGEAEALLERLVNINSGTMNPEGVRQVGKIFASRFEAMGFETRWIPMARVNRSGHLFATRRGTRGKRLLLIGHLDTVFEKDSEFQRAERLSGHRMRGPGAMDMKGGDVVILHALEALHSIGALDGADITVALTGDEESPGQPLEVSRADLIEAARRADVALEFEEGVGGPNTATVARRGFTSWWLEVKGTRGHSSLIFSDEYGAGAAFEVARILSAFHDQLAGEQYLTFSAGLVLAGTAADLDREHARGAASGKSNVIAEVAMASGDLRTLTMEQRDRIKQKMRDIVARGLPGTSARIEFRDEYPPMAPTAGNQALFDQLDVVSRDLGLGPVQAVDPGKRGAADSSFAAPHADTLAGLGPVGDDSHTPRETLYLDTLPMATKRAAVFVYRLTR
jgi:glutamate carboxypeptidase